METQWDFNRSNTMRCNQDPNARARRIAVAIHAACALAWLSESPREVSCGPAGEIRVSAPECTPLGFFVIGTAHFVGGNDGEWSGA